MGNDRTRLSPRRLSRRDGYLLTNSVVLAWLVLAIAAIVGHRFVSQPLWLLVHVPLLGAATAAILVWSQHFADTLLRRPVPGGRPGLAVRLGLHSLGTLMLGGGVLAGVPALAIAGGSVVAAAIAVHLGLLGMQSRGALPARFAPLVRYYLAAGAVFLVGIAVGVVMAVVRNPALTDRAVTAHLVLNVYGWIGLTALGTLVLLWPTVLHARVEPAADRAAARALPLLVAGIAVAALASAVDVRALVAAGMVGWLAGLALLGREGVRQARAMPPGTFAGWSLAAATGWLAVSAVALGVAAMAAPDWATFRASTVALLGPLVAGFGVQVLLGALSHLLPVVALGSPAAARAGAAELDRGGAFRATAFNGAIAIYLLPMPSLARVLLSFVAVGVAVATIVLAVRAVVVGRRVRRGEGAAPDRSGVVTIGMPRHAPEPRRPRASAVAAAVVLLVACVGGGVAADPAASGIPVAAAPDTPATGDTTDVTVRVTGMRYDPAVIEVPVGDELVVTFENTGIDVHDLTFATGVRTERLAPGARETVTVGVIGADLPGWCSIAGHRQMGMELTVRAIGAPAAQASAAATSTEHSAHGGSGASEGEDAAADIDLQREPAASFRAHPAELPPAPEETVHRVTLTVTETVAEVAPGVPQTRWTFGGAAPGPVLRGRIGDTFEITLVNDGTIGHSVDFHAGALAPDEPMRTIGPGETLTYTFTATRAGIWMYHCSTMPMSMHIANGMSGAVVIDPPDLVPVDREYLLVQNELYLGSSAGTADAEKLAEARPDLVVFNGVADQYRHRPLAARPGERVRVWVLDAGPNSPSSFHVVGGQFDTVYLEGSYALRPEDAGGSQALGLQPAQGGFVELVFPEAGTYPFVTHRMSDAERGAAGLFRVE